MCLQDKGQLEEMRALAEARVRKMSSDLANTKESKKKESKKVDKRQRQGQPAAEGGEAKKRGRPRGT